MLEQIVLNYQPLIVAKELVVKLDGEHFHVYGSRDFFVDAFSQLILNAIQYSRKGGEIRIHSKKEDKATLVTIEDDGVGISAEMLPHIFERFWRQDTAHSTAGFGLGLPLAQAVIEKHGGTIRVESELGKGSRFEVRLLL